jgi:hypothetical protein
VSVVVPKNLPFNFPSNQIKPYFVDEGDQFTLNVYFFDPSTICSNQGTSYPYVADRLVIKGDSLERTIPTTAEGIAAEGFWSRQKCVPTMGTHYYADLLGPVSASSQADNTFPIGLLFDNGKLIGFQYVFNADLTSPRFEKPTSAVLSRFLYEVASFYYDPNQSAYAASSGTSQHFYFDSNPQLIQC